MSPSEQLSYREIKVTTLVWQGRTNPEIALTLGTSEQVVKNQLRSVFDKLGVWSRLELAPLCGCAWRRQVGRLFRNRAQPSHSGGFVGNCRASRTSSGQGLDVPLQEFLVLRGDVAETHPDAKPRRSTGNRALQAQLGYP